MMEALLPSARQLWVAKDAAAFTGDCLEATSLFIWSHNLPYIFVFCLNFGCSTRTFAHITMLLDYILGLLSILIS